MGGGCFWNPFLYHPWKYSVVFSDFSKQVLYVIGRSANAVVFIIYFDGSCGSRGVIFQKNHNFNMLNQFGKFFKGFNNTENPSASGRA
jgi:hypothetical protein